MTLREKLADWISGGMLTHWRDLVATHEDDRILARDFWRISNDGWEKSLDIANQYQNALRYIIEQDTPGANATVKRIVNVAKGALK